VGERKALSSEIDSGRRGDDSEAVGVLADINC
jgi:hypothetical protein